MNTPQKLFNSESFRIFTQIKVTRDFQSMYPHGSSSTKLFFHDPLYLYSTILCLQRLALLSIHYL